MEIIHLVVSSQLLAEQKLSQNYHPCTGDNQSEVDSPYVSCYPEIQEAHIVDQVRSSVFRERAWMANGLCCGLVGQSTIMCKMLSTDIQKYLCVDLEEIDLQRPHICQEGINQMEDGTGIGMHIVCQEVYQCYVIFILTTLSQTLSSVFQIRKLKEVK